MYRLRLACCENELTIEHKLTNLFSALRFEYFFADRSGGVFAQVIFIEVHEKVRLDENLIVDSINICVRVVMPHQVADAINKFFIKAQIRQHFPGSSRPFLFLQFSVAVTIFCSAGLIPMSCT